LSGADRDQLDPILDAWRSFHFAGKFARRCN
jgi:hypothetical protein